MSARILVVDDIMPNVKLLEAKLGSEYYDVVTATSGQEALDKIPQVRPDLVLLDIMMPGMDGFEVCERIKRDPSMSHIPVVMVTALTESEDRVRGLEAGADDFLSKPVNDVALMSRVRSLVRLKMTVDEWRARENTANQFGVAEEEGSSFLEESYEKANILVIEDREFEREKFQTVFSEDDHNVDMCDNGKDAITKIQDTQYELIVVSLDLENEDSLRLCSQFKTNQKTRSTPILMTGETDDMPRIAQGLEMGAHDYILRPIDNNELLARVRTQIRRKRFQDHLRSNYEMRLTMALKDELTGLYNRRYLQARLENFLQEIEVSDKKFGILIFDIDHFKEVNDTHGHGVGDEILKIFAKRLQEQVRSFDLVARLGGEEFVTIHPDINEDAAKYIAERLRRCIADDPIPCDVEDGELTITTSIGGALIDSSYQHVDKVLKVADDALYKAKAAGRNVCVFADGEELDPEKYKEFNRKFAE